MNEFVKDYIEDVMFILLDKIARLKNVDFSKVDNKQIASVIKRLAYDTLITYYYVYDEDIELVTGYIKKDLSTGTRWAITSDKILLEAPNGITITMTVTDVESLEGLSGSVTGNISETEKVISQESLNNTRLSIENNIEELIYKNGNLHMKKGEEETNITGNVHGLNTLINLSRNRIINTQPASKR